MGWPTLGARRREAVSCSRSAGTDASARDAYQGDRHRDAACTVAVRAMSGFAPDRLVPGHWNRFLLARRPRRRCQSALACAVAMLLSRGWRKLRVRIQPCRASCGAWAQCHENRLAKASNRKACERGTLVGAELSTSTIFHCIKAVSEVSYVQNRA